MGSVKKVVMAKGEKTTLTKANVKSYSLRTTVPKGVVKQLDLKEGNSIVWKLVPQGDKFIIVVEPFTEKENSKKRRNQK